MDEFVVQTENLTKVYGDRLAVDGVSMSVRRGEVYGFLGPNGAGKTTTLRMLLGLIRPTSGTARVLGDDSATPAVIARVGALVEGPGFYPYLSGRDNLRVLARYRSLPDADVDAALDRVDLAGRGTDRYKSYSLGMKQRLGVAAALMGEPELIILDEPTNGLDPAGMADMRSLVVALARGGQTVLLSSHLLAEVQEICDRVGVINGGKLLRESTVAELRGGAHIVLRAEPADLALRIATRLTAPDRVRRDGDRILIDTTADIVPGLARQLVGADVAIHELHTQERSLEEVFFELTTTSGPAASARELETSR